MSRSGKLRSILFLTMTGAAATCFAQSTAPHVNLNLPAQSLSASLTQFGHDAGVEIEFTPKSVQGKTAPALKGDLDRDQALKRLLQGSGLTYRVTAQGAIIVEPLRVEAPASPGLTNALDSPAPHEGEADSSNGPTSGEGREEDRTNLQEVLVTGRYQFLAADTQGTTNLPLPIEQVPQSISLVSGDFIKAADLNTLGAIASYTPGAIDAGNPENNGSVIKIRGFSAGRAIDGIDAISTFTSYEPEFAIVDRLEIVEGPSSVVYGISSPGGLVNYVTKSATHLTPSYLSAQVSSWRGIRVEGQIAKPLDSQERVRGIGIAVWDQGNSFIDDLHHRKSVLYGGLNVDFTDSVSGYIHGGYQRFTRPSFDGVPTEADGTPAPVPRSFFLGSKDIELKTSVYFGSGELTWRPSSVLEFSLKGNYERSSLTGGNDYAFDLADSGDVTFQVTKFSGPQVTENYGIGASSIYRLDATGLKDSFISIAALYQDSKQSTAVLFPGTSGTLNIFDSREAITQAFNSLLGSGPVFPYDSDIDTHTFTVSAQSVTRFFERLSVLAGASYSKPKVSTLTNEVVQDYNFDGQVSYRAGLVYEILPRTNAYISYSESFNPQPLLTIAQTPLPPLVGKQYEAGIKVRTLNARLLLSGALYRITERNLATYDQSLNGADFYKAVGEVRHNGLEIKALGELTPDWQINTGYAYLDPKVTRDADPSVEGQTELYLPKHTFSLYSTYRLPAATVAGLSLGGGVRFIDSVATSYDGSTRQIPSYTLVDLSASYERGPWYTQLSLSNVLNKRYYINNYQTLFYGNVPGSPTSASLTLRRQF
ncbi:MAG: TonB-dependent receptor [Proteobacteria bacterium]|nr:TonB-dependent receptor [Pseudomonadota bacterium]